jgi:hypothetical protein
MDVLSTYYTKRCGYAGEYFDNIDYTGTKVDRQDPKILFGWGSNAPISGISPGTFSIKWNKTGEFDEGVYRFNVNTSLIARVYVDGEKIIDTNIKSTLSAVKRMTKGTHSIRVEYAHDAGSAAVRFNYVHAYTCPDLNGDGNINAGDQQALAPHILAGDTGFSAFDLNGDGAVNSGDQLLLSQKFGQNCS